MFCAICEGQEFEKVVSITTGLDDDLVTLILYKCLECGLLKFVKIESNIRNVKSEND